jgi:hypothetical protein
MAMILSQYKIINRYTTDIDQFRNLLRLFQLKTQYWITNSMLTLLYRMILIPMLPEVKKKTCRFYTSSPF